MTLRAATLLLTAFLLPVTAHAETKMTPAPAGATIPAASDETYQQLRLFGEVFERVKADFVEPVTDEKLVEAALNGMLTQLDPHSGYMTKDEFRDMQISTRGVFGGLGIEVTMDNGVVKVISPIDETPASRAGLESGDLIVALDETPVSGMTLQEAVNKMRGTPGTPIKLKVVREGREPFDVSIIRDIIKVQSVRSRVEGKAGYIRISSFTDQTQKGLEAAVADIRKQLGADLQGWVLDLRNNPGGLLEQGVSVADSFLETGDIVSTRGRDEKDNNVFTAEPGELGDGKPVVVLINSGSASAAEIVAGALQDNRRGVVMGTKSFGKGSVQTVMPIGGHGAIRLTTARYYTPSGRSIQAEGISPDIVVEPAKVEKISEEGVFKEANLKGALKNDTSKPETAPKEAVPEAKPPKDRDAAEAEAAKKDYQLARALDLLQGLSLYRQAVPTKAEASQAEASTP